MIHSSRGEIYQSRGKTAVPKAFATVSARATEVRRAVIAMAILGATVQIMSVSGVTLALAIAVLVVQLALVVFCNLPQFYRQDRAAPQTGPLGAVLPPRLSIHVPAHNEPVSLLIATLECLRDQRDAPDYEVIVILNNTDDPALWRPVFEWCSQVGPPFRILKRDGVVGAKAGALNIALSETDARATHVVIIDADYQVTPDFLSTVRREIAATGADFLQFPQSYRNLTAATEGLSFELADYFNRHARAANLAKAMLLTGTLSVIRRDALVAVGGWPHKSCTEDAELGTSLIAAGYSGMFIDRTMGRGLMPLDLTGLHMQRHRWAQGNARVLQTTLARWATRRDAVTTNWLHKALVISQLSAWLNMGAPALVLLCVGLAQIAVGLAAGQPTAVAQTTVALSLTTIVLVVANAGLPLLYRVDGPITGTTRLRALYSRLAMIPVSASATVSGLMPRAQPFHVTRKGGPAVSVSSEISAHLASALVGYAVIATAMVAQNAPGLAAGVLMLLPAACARSTRAAIAAYAASVTAEEDHQHG